MNNRLRALVRLTNNIYRCTQVYMDKKLEPFELTTGSYPYLLALNGNEGISQSDVSRELNVDRAMSARTIKKLMELGYIKKEENKDDIRAYKLYLTDKGKNIIPKIAEIIDKWTDILVEGNEEEEIEASIEFLGKILERGKKYRKDHCERMKRIE